MNRNWSVRSRVAIALPFCLSLWGLAAPVSAKTIVVTILNDTADSPFNADGDCGTGTINDLPGADGLISLREAIIAANNTPGADTITFSRGGTITVNFDGDADGAPDPLPALCGGQTRIKGDLNGDDVPDIMLDGMALPASPPAAGLLVVSSHNTIQGLHVRHFPIGISVQAGDFPTPGTPGTVKHTMVTNNILADSSLHGILMLTQGDHNLLSHGTIALNTVFSNALSGIVVWGGFGRADENTLDVDVKDNTVTDNGLVGIGVFAGRDNSSHNRVVARIRRNTLERH